jgi:hypothetical protein
MASNSGDSSASALTSLLSGHPLLEVVTKQNSEDRDWEH